MINITGVSESRVAPVAAYISEQNKQSIIIVSTEVRGKRLASDLSFFAKNKEIIMLPAEEKFLLKYAAKNHDQLIQRLKALKYLRTGKPVIVIVPVTGAVKKLPPHGAFEEKKLAVNSGGELDLDYAKDTLVNMGYERVDIVSQRGQFSVRGGIIDIFTPDGENPYRIELFGTEVDSIRTFDADTQRSVNNINSILIYPAQQLTGDSVMFQKAVETIEREYTSYAKKLAKTSPEAGRNLEKTRDELCEYIKNVSNVQLLEKYIHYFYKDTEYIWDYMTDGVLMVDDPDRVREVLSLQEKELKEDFKTLLERGQTVPSDAQSIPSEGELDFAYRYDNVAVFTPFPKRIEGIDSFDKVYNLQSRQVISFNGKLNVLESELKSYIKRGYKTTIVCSTKERIENLRDFVTGAGLEAHVFFEEGNLTAGMDFPTEKLCYISDKDIFINTRITGKRAKYKNKGQKILSFADMRPGDYVVHENYGIGKFLEITQLEEGGHKKDFIKIKYAGEDLLYVPVERMDVVQKYIGSDGSAPKLNKFAGNEWKAAKAKAKAAIEEMAKELVELYAKRKMVKGYSFGADTTWQKEFEDSFPFRETDDQLRATEEIKEDMEKPFSMDRLLCGDVGFGKTEVAARALFKCLAEGKQGAVLVPTTILANQHYYTLKERFEKFPFKVDVLSRFRTPKQQESIIKDLNKGQIDLIIGTHRLLSKDVQFKDLGLLVVDEEQRFGVEHKEQIKKLKSNVDVLTLSATPIPRTLNMSLTGIKDMSLIEEPPEERYPVQTYVLEQDDQLIKEIIERELGRGGQVFVVYNRVRGIQQVAGRIKDLVPDARIVVGHGQMNETLLENQMLSFINGENNVMVATTIIESGIDIPNANTLIVMDADRYGLSQLYQLRGRVGRSTRMAYAYLMYQRDKVLTEVAEKRLKAIREFTEFGAGFKVAMRDLEIRGAGNLLGVEQHGHMASVGYEMYCKMVDDAVKALQGEIVNETREDTSVEIRVPANIPARYIENEALKLHMYKKIASVQTSDDEDDIVDELLDRFGDIPDETMNLIKISRIRFLAGGLAISRVSEEKTVKERKTIKFEFLEHNPLSPIGLMNVTEKYGNRVSIYGGALPTVKFSVNSRHPLNDIVDMLKILDENKKTEV